MRSSPLPRRLLRVAEMARGAHCAVDIGSDHGKLPVYLSKLGIRVIAVDSSPAACKKTLALAARAETELDVRLGDGLSVIKPGEADVCIIAGLGGREILRILLDAPDISRAFGAIVMQPMQHQDVLRERLRLNGFAIGEEALVPDGGRLFEVIRASFCARADEFPEGWPPEFHEIGWQAVRAADPLMPALIARRVKELRRRLAEAKRGGAEEAIARLSERLACYIQVERLLDKEMARR